jgi:hypothetical protein
MMERNRTFSPSSSTRVITMYDFTAAPSKDHQHDFKAIVCKKTVTLSAVIDELAKALP